MTNEERDLMFAFLKKVQHHDLYVFDTSNLSTCTDAETASYLIWLSLFSIKIYAAIIDLYTFDITGCLDSGL